MKTNTMQIIYQRLEVESKHYEKACKENKQELLKKVGFEIDEINAQIQIIKKKLMRKQTCLNGNK